MIIGGIGQNYQTLLYSVIVIVIIVLLYMYYVNMNNNSNNKDDSDSQTIPQGPKMDSMHGGCPGCPMDNKTNQKNNSLLDGTTPVNHCMKKLKARNPHLQTQVVSSYWNTIKSDPPKDNLGQPKAKCSMETITPMRNKNTNEYYNSYNNVVNRNKMRHLDLESMYSPY